MMIAFDAQYDDASQRAQVAGVVFENWTDSRPLSEHVWQTTDVAPYQPGQFYRRELPLLLELLRQVQNEQAESIDLAVIDGFVDLGDHPGLGRHFWEAVGQAFPIVGVAKSPFRNAPAEQVLRGVSKRPLYITTVGVDARQTAQQVQAMHGPHRIPTLLQQVDALARSKS